MHPNTFRKDTSIPTASELHLPVSAKFFERENTHILQVAIYT